MMNATTRATQVRCPCQASGATGPVAGRTTSVVPRTAVTMTGAPVAIGWWPAGEGQPGLAGQPDVPGVELVADLVEGERALADEPAVDARRQRRLAVAASRRLRNGRPTTTPSSATAMARTAWIQIGLSGTKNASRPAGERAEGQEDREERRAGELEHEQRQRGHEPDHVQRHVPSVCVPQRSAGRLFLFADPEGPQSRETPQQ